MLRLESLRVAWDQRPILDGISLAFEAGKMHGLLGSNGSGKSTLLRALLGLAPIRGGTILFRDQDLRGNRHTLRRETGVVFQDPALDLKLSCRENLELAARVMGAPTERVGEALVSAGLGERGDELAGTLSGGQRRRLDLARALLHRPTLLLLDEPTAGLDVRATDAFLEQLDLQRRAGVTILVATHRPEEADRCDRLAILGDGQVVFDDTPAALRARIEPDVIELELDEPEAARDALAAWGSVTIAAGRLRIACHDGPDRLARVLAAIPLATIRSATLRRASLADAFLSLTGRELLGRTPARRP